MSATAPRPGGAPTPQRMLAIYLNDHLAGATGGVGLARRMVQEHGESAHGKELRALASAIAEDRATLLRLMSDLEVTPRRYKIYAAWLGEKVGRAKPNGRLLRRSGLTLLVELEAMRLGVQGKVLLWRTLHRAAAVDPRLDSDELLRLLSRAEDQLISLDSLHAKAAAAVSPLVDARQQVSASTP
ncbi:hypothetical protein [Streptomyces sp. NPDC002779]|uniref:hypothetical protein n=1 Tax=Streptomyces sp. NPDC002779 TaxID=3364664 RepID=UPI0036A19FBC